MNILIIAGLFYPAKLGGPANTLFWLSKALVKKGHSVRVVTSSHQIDDNKIHIDEWNEVEGVHVRYCKINNKLGLSIVKWAQVESDKADAIILSSICYLPNTLVARYALKKGIRVIWSPRGELLGDKVRKNWGKRLLFRYIKHLGKDRICFHATSEEEKASIQYFFGTKCQIPVIPNYLILPPKSLRQTDGTDYFLYVGRIAPIKRIDNIIRALSLSKLFANSGNIFKIVGGVEPQFEEYHKELRDLIKDLKLDDKVEFVGPLHGDAKFQCYANAKYLFLVSKSENFGNVIVESLSQGTPVVASTGTPWQILVKEGAGSWVDNEPEILAACVDNIIALPTDEYLKQREDAYRLAKKYDVYENIDKWENILK